MTDVDGPLLKFLAVLNNSCAFCVIHIKKKLNTISFPHENAGLAKVCFSHYILVASKISLCFIHDFMECRRGRNDFKFPFSRYMHFVTYMY